LFTGKERDQETELDYFEARFLDTEIARFLQPDPHDANYPDMSPFNYVGANPVSRTDPDGKDWGDYVKGALVAVVDNATGMNFRPTAEYADARDYNRGQDMGELFSMAFAGIEIDGGTGAVAASVTGTVASGGAAIEVTLPTAVGGVAAIAHGSLMLSNASSNYNSKKGRVDESNGNSVHGNSVKSEKPSGNYEVTFESGKKYNGVGNKKRAEKSANLKATKNDDPVVLVEWAPASNKREALIKEDKDIKRNGGAGNTQRNYNIRNSPGAKLQKEKNK
jgi:RHS repeat-associated protein